MPEKTYGANVYFTSNPNEIDNEITFDANKPIPERTPAVQASAPSAPAVATAPSVPANTATPVQAKATEVIEAKPRVLDKKAVYYTTNPGEIDNVITFDANKPLPDVGSETAVIAEPVVEDATPANEEYASEPVYEEPAEQEPIPAYLAYEQAQEEAACEEVPAYEEPVAEAICEETPAYEEPENEPAFEEAPAYEEATFESTATEPAVNYEVMPATVENEVEEPASEEVLKTKKEKKKCVIASVLGIVSIPLSIIALLIGLACSCSCGALLGSILSVIFATIGFILGLVSVILSIIKTRRPSIFGIVGIILSVLTIVITILFVIIAMVANIGLNIFANSQY